MKKALIGFLLCMGVQHLLAQACPTLADTSTLSGSGIFCPGTQLNIGIYYTSPTQMYLWKQNGKPVHGPLSGNGDSQSFQPLSMDASLVGNYVVQTWDVGCPDTNQFGNVTIYYDSVVTGLSVTALQDTSVMFQWSSLAPGTLYSYSVTTDPSNPGAISDGTNTSGRMGALQPGTTYTIYVAGECDNSFSSSGTFDTLSFTTPANPCIGNTGLALPGITTAGNVDYICGTGGTLLLTSSATQGNRWFRDSLPLGDFAQTYAAPDSGVYYVQTTDASGCFAFSDTLPVTQRSSLPPPSITVSGNTSFCQGDSVVLSTALPVSSQWYRNGSAITGANDTILVALQAGRYTVGPLSASACTPLNDTAADVTVQLNPLDTPGIHITATAATTCAGVPVMFTAIATQAGSGPSYQWELNGANVGTNSPSFSGSSGGTIQCVLTANAACATSEVIVSNTDTLAVVQAVQPAISITASANNFCGDSAVTFTALAVPGGAGPTYQWEVNGAEVGTDSYTYENGNLKNGDIVSCVLTSNRTCSTGTVSSNDITMNIAPAPVVALPADTTIQAGSSVQLTPSVFGTATAYQWIPDSGLNNPGIADPLASPLQTTTYEVRVTTSQGCVSTATEVVNVFTYFNMPNAFSPNGDGVNDIFRIPESETVNAPNFVVYARSGELLFQTSSRDQGWDGTFNGHPQPVGAYIWMLQYNDPVTGKRLLKKGTVTLMR